MPELELTDEDVAAIRAIDERWPLESHPARCDYYRAGLAAGYRRGIKDALACCKNKAWKPKWSDSGKLTVSQAIAKSIQELLK